jgi:branched-chain amino acid transport system substrate-binding protein
MNLRIPSSLVAFGLALQAQTSVKLGVINCVTGTQAPIGEYISNGYKLAVEDLQKKGIKVELVSEDDTGKPQVSMSAFEKLATRDRVAAVVGPYSSACANAVSKLAEKYKVPLLVPVASKEDITRQNQKFVFRLSATTEDYASILISMAQKLGQPKTMAILNENTDFGTSGAKSAKAYAAQVGLQVVAEEAYQAGSPDYRSTLAKVKATKPDLVFMVSYVADGILLMRQAREVGLQPQAFLGAGAGFASSEFAREQAISHGVFSSTQWTVDVSWPGAKDFGKRYKAKFGKDEVPYHAANAYASMMVMAEAAAKVGGDREKLRAALRDGKWDGIMGPVKFADYNGYTNQNRHQMLVEQIQNGKHETVWPPEYGTKKPLFPFKWK